MTKLIATSPIGKNGQTVVPASIRRIFQLHHRYAKVGFFLHDNRIEIAPVEERRGAFSARELNKLDKLATEKGGAVFKSAQAAKEYLRSL